MNKSIFLGIKAETARGMPQEVGEVIVTVPQTGMPFPIRGRIRKVFREADGLLLLLDNLGYKNDRFGCWGWRIIPLWLSSNGQSGILATWKDNSLQQLCDAEEMTMYREADNSQAL